MHPLLLFIRATCSDDESIHGDIPYHLLEHLQLHEGRAAVLDRFHIFLSCNLHVRQQIFNTLGHALCMRAAPLLVLLALKDGFKFIILLLCFIIGPRPLPVPVVLALTELNIHSSIFIIISLTV